MFPLKAVNLLETPAKTASALRVLADPFDRHVSYLRLSLTDRCNFRCTYCFTDTAFRFRPRAEILTFEEIERIVQTFCDMGVVRLRFTGGEPTLRRDLHRLIERLAKMPTLEEGKSLKVVMTTNAFLLADMAADVAAAGVGEVNSSLDTLQEDRFQALTKSGKLSQVIAGIDAAIAAGLKVKLNTVALKGVNDDEFASLALFAWDRKLNLRFIEHMPMSGGEYYKDQQRVSAAEIRQQITAYFGLPLVPRDSKAAHGPARYWSQEGKSHRQIGIISPISENFCDTCNRVRISATGDLHPCLGYDQATSLRDLMRGGASNETLRRAISTTLAGKKARHDFQVNGQGGPRKSMISMGG